MITFETKMLPNGLWQFRAVGKVWSEPLSLVRCMVEMKAATRVEPEPKQWSKPLAIGIKRKRPYEEQAKVLYEIRGGKVQRIAANAAERREQQVDEILAALEALEG